VAAAPISAASVLRIAVSLPRGHQLLEDISVARDVRCHQGCWHPAMTCGHHAAGQGWPGAHPLPAGPPAAVQSHHELSRKDGPGRSRCRPANLATSRSRASCRAGQVQPQPASAAGTRRPASKPRLSQAAAIWSLARKGLPGTRLARAGMPQGARAASPHGIRRGRAASQPLARWRGIAVVANRSVGTVPVRNLRPQTAVLAADTNPIAGHGSSLLPGRLSILLPRDERAHRRSARPSSWSATTAPGNASPDAVRP